MQTEGHSSRVASKRQEETRQLFRNRYDLFEVIKRPEFVDKTMLVKAILEDVKVVLVTAPSKFGKTCNIEMVKRFLELQVDENGNPKKVEETENYKLFKNNEDKLAICRDKVFFDKHFGQYPLIFLKFTILQTVNCYERFIVKLRCLLHGIYCSYEYLLEAQNLWEDELDIEDFKDYFFHGRFEHLNEEQIKRGFSYLTQVLHKRFKKKVFVLIDNYDGLVVSLSAVDIVDDTSKRMIALFRGIISSLLKNNPHVDRVYLSGYLRVAGAGLSPDGNNIAHYQFLHNHAYLPFYGFTHNEMEKLLDTFNMSDKLQEVESLHSLKPLHDRNQKMYCTFSILRYLESKNIYQHWSEGHLLKKLEALIFLEEVSLVFRRFWAEEAIKIKSVKKMYLSELLHLRRLFEVLPPVLAETNDIHLYMQYLCDFNDYFNVLEREGTQLTIEPSNVMTRREISDMICKARSYSRTYNFDSENISSFCNSLVWLRDNDEMTFIKFRKSIEEMFRNLYRLSNSRKKRRIYYY